MPHTLSAKSVRERITHFMHLEASGGIVLMFVEFFYGLWL